MPIITLATTARLDPDLSARLARTVTALTETHLRKDPTITAVAISHVDPLHWFAGGRSLAEQGAETFWLDIKVVDGTNTKLQLSAYLQHVFTEVGAILGGAHTESYVLVHEVPGSAYGYGGRTQEYRFIAGQLPVAV
ncbi:MAG: 4-oxalocrotonate tautomerase family protein [Rhizobiaceae bacterium]|nr:4-oxalocrotonate tautomerase family protein [Rhizobiaceae bacterium]